MNNPYSIDDRARGMANAFSNQAPVTSKPEPKSLMIQLLDELKQLLDELDSRVTTLDSRLGSVMREIDPSPQAEKPSRIPYPPVMNLLRDYNEELQAHNTRLSSILSRLEV